MLSKADWLSRLAHFFLLNGTPFPQCLPFQIARPIPLNDTLLLPQLPLPPGSRLQTSSSSHSQARLQPGPGQARALSLVLLGKYSRCVRKLRTDTLNKGAGPRRPTADRGASCGWASRDEHAFLSTASPWGSRGTWGAFGACGCTEGSEERRRGGRSQTRPRLGRVPEATAVPPDLGLSPSPGTARRVALGSSFLSALRASVFPICPVDTRSRSLTRRVCCSGDSILPNSLVK